MGFHEKTAWAMGAILTLSGLFYFHKVLAVSEAIGETAPPIIGFVIAYVVLVVIASIIVMSVLAASAAAEANAPADEREKRVIDRAGHWSSYILAFGVALGLLHFWTQRDGNFLFHVCFASLMLSQIAEYGFQIWFLRRGI